jgi:hypothetical protein
VWMGWGWSVRRRNGCVFISWISCACVGRALVELRIRSVGLCKHICRCDTFSLFLLISLPLSLSLSLFLSLSLPQMPCFTAQLPKVRMRAGALEVEVHRHLIRVLLCVLCVLGVYMCMCACARVCACSEKTCFGKQNGQGEVKKHEKTRTGHNLRIAPCVA